MNQKFNILGDYEYPELSILNPDGTELCSVSNYINLKTDLKFNNTSVLSFDIYEYDNKGKNPCYDLIQVKRKIDAGENLGKYIITNVSKSSSGEILKNDDAPLGDNPNDIVYKKTVTCFDLGHEFTYKTVYVDGTRKFYSAEDGSGLLNELVALVPSWSIGYVTPDLWNKYRTFSDLSTNVYNMMMQEMEKSYECIFDFDVVNKIVNAYTPDDAVYHTDIFLSFDNVVNNIDIQSSDEQLITALTVSGADGVYINGVNPLGGSVIYDFSYFLNPELDLMDFDLIGAVNAWNDKIELNRENYSSLLLQMKNYHADLTNLNIELVELQGELKVLEEQRWAKIESSQTLGTITSQINAKQVEINAKQAEVTAKNNQIETVASQLEIIVDSLSFSNNFTSTQLIKLQNYIYQGEYVDDTFVYTDTMTNEEKQDISQDLYDKAKRELTKLAQPSLTFTVSAQNFVLLEEFEAFTKQLKLGCSMAVEIKPSEVAYPILLEVSMDYDNPENSTFTFGNAYRLRDDNWTIEELFNQSNSSSQTISIKGNAWSLGADTHNEFNEYLNNALDLSRQSITTSSEQLFTIGEFGIRGKKSNSLEEIWINNNLMCFTKDGWQTASLAIGKITLPSGGTGYGLNCGVLIGNLVASNQLYISNSANTFKVDASGATLTNATFTLNQGSNSIVISPTAGITAISGTTTKFRFDIATGNCYFMGDLTGSTGTFSGQITANVGSIGGWTINSYGLTSPYGDYLRSDGSVKLGLMTITPSSVTFGSMLTMTSSSATFNGNIYARNLVDKVQTSNLASRAVTTDVLDDSSITYTKIVNEAVRDQHIASINAEKIMTGYISSARIAARSITADKLSVTSLSAITGNIGTINTGTINLGGITISSGYTGEIRYNGSTTCYISMSSSILSLFNSNQINISTISGAGVNIGGNCHLPFNTYWNDRKITTYLSGGRTYLVLV